MTSTDVLIVGAGLIGLSTALHLQKRRPDIRVHVIEKNDRVAAQQSGHNSGVIHAGIYYEPGSLKARFCVEGHRALQDYCLQRDIAVIKCGKLIVAQGRKESERLAVLFERGQKNGVAGLRLIERAELREIEPNVDGDGALLSPESAIVDYKQVAAAYADDVRSAGGQVHLETAFVASADAGNVRRITTSGPEFDARLVINCAGLHCDVVAKKMGADPKLRIIPFRGEYYVLDESRSDIVRGLIYPVPDPSLPFLDVHLTPTVSGSIEAGPNAVLATRREGYRRSDFSFSDFWSTLSYPGFWRLAARNIGPGVAEIHRSLRKSVFVRSLNKLVPDIVAADLRPGGAGVRAQAVDRQGRLVDDFRIEDSPGAIHVLNAPSPAATSSLMIGQYVASAAAKRLDNDT